MSEPVMTWAELLELGRRKLLDAGIAEAELDAWYLFSHAFGLSRAQYFLRAQEAADVPREPADMAQKAADGRMDWYIRALARRAEHVPLQYILGTQEFMGLEFAVNEHVLIPRQDTETLVETVLAENKEKGLRILDLGTGSGCIAVSLAALGGYENVEAADLSREALLVAGENARRLLGCASGAIRFRVSDLFSAFGASERFDVIVSNPPYIASAEIETLQPEVREHEPRLALDGAADGLGIYRRLAAECGGHLTPGGRVYFEIGYDQGEAVCGLLAQAGFCEIRVRKDLAGKNRIVSGSWPGQGKSGLPG